MKADKIGDYSILLLMAVQASISLVFPPYRDISWIKDTWFGNDLVTLFFVCPLFLSTLFSKQTRSMIINIGCVGYVVYNYCFYMLGTHLNSMFLVYVILFILGIHQLLTKIIDSDFGEVLNKSFDLSRNYLFPACIFLFIGGGLASVWIGTWVNYTFLNGKLPTDESAFRLVAALDLVFIVSLMVISGIALIRKIKIGFILGSVVGVQSFLYLSILVVNSATISFRHDSTPSELPIWLSLLVVESLGIASLILKNGVKSHSNI